ncbi:hypothetical protein [Aerosakkonema funiforme]|uniref:hypothetical protein n=1 Tax=Aerosakkonema funiforme TaxID=1246630 RepID=UPI0035BC9443
MNNCSKFSKLQLLGWSLLTAAIAAVTYPKTTFAQSVSSGYQIVNRELAVNSAIDIKVYPGRASAIDFSQTDEVVSYVLIADPSRLVFGTDAQLTSAQAKTVFLRPIQTLRFPGATTAQITSLSLKTVDSQGKQRLYSFNVIPARTSANPNYLGIRIAAVSPRLRQQRTSSVNAGRSITLSDVERGLLIAVQRQYTAPNDPVVYQVQQFLTKMRENNLSAADAAAAVGVDLSVIFELAKIGRELPYSTPNYSRTQSSV